MSASVLGRIVPCQAGNVGVERSSVRKIDCFLSSLSPLEVSSILSGESTTEGPLTSSLAGATPCRIVQGLLTSGLISANRCFSSSVGCQLLPSGGPKRAQLLSCLAKSVV